MGKTKSAQTGANRKSHGKDTEIFFSNQVRQKVFELFLSGKSFSVVELCDMLHIPDPRSHIRFIRSAGVPISDFWQKTPFSRHKVYFFHNREGGLQ
jgi:hypothetical protein